MSRRTQPSYRRSPGQMPPTIHTIAEQLGIHPSTVSRALNPSSASRVSARTRAAVVEVAERIGYRPDPLARGLRTKRSLLLGLLIPRLADVVLARMFEGAEDRARDLGYQAITTSTRDEPGVERELAEGLLRRRVEGLILATPTTDDPFLDELSERGTPFVLLNRSSGGHPCVRGDDEMGGYLATRHLVSRSHRRIAIIAGPPQVSTTTLRRHGYERALKEAQITFDSRLLVHSSLDAEGGYDAAAQLMAMSHPPTAIFAVNDSVAIGAMAAARDLGRVVPADLAVVGYNDSDVSGMLSIPLTSVALPLLKMGERSVDLLVDRLEGRPIESFVFTPRLVVRASSAGVSGA